ncbi:MAG: YiiX/YebB-like N1pC/P60 family cysteine hydrolase [Flammeovirgaceae bacterium]
MKKGLLPLIALLSFGPPLVAQKSVNDRIQVGDILFQDMDCGPMCEAIERVTTGWSDRNFSHLGLVISKNDSLFVLEAIGKDVHLTPLNTFIYRSATNSGQPKVVVSRLRKRYHALIPKAIEFAIQQIGVAYDDDFLYDNGKYYCSELIYEAFKNANSGIPLFELKPMTFHDPVTGKPFPVWEDYFKNKNAPIPQGQPGCNPGGISQSPKIRIVRSLY